jgi:hypothetical protein
VTTAAKPGKSAAAQPAQKLRDVQPKTLPPSSLKPLGYGETEIMTITLPPEWGFDDLINPAAFANVVNPIAANSIKTQVDRVGSLIYVSTADNSFVAWLRINRIVRNALGNPCGVEVLCIGPSIDLKTGKPRPLDLATGLPWTDPVRPAAAA